MSTPGATELLIVLVIVLLILGPKRLPSLGRQLGGGIREFRRSLGRGDDESARVPHGSGHRRDATVAPAAPAASTPGENAAGELDSERRSV